MRLFTVCIAALFAGLVPAPAMANLMEGARGCAQETNRLERLACYDDLFGMPTETAREARLPRAISLSVGARRLHRLGSDKQWCIAIPVMLPGTW